MSSVAFRCSGHASSSGGAARQAPGEDTALIGAGRQLSCARAGSPGQPLPGLPSPLASTSTRRHGPVPIHLDHVHPAIDDHTRQARAGALADERVASRRLPAASGGLSATRSVPVRRVPTDGATSHRRGDARIAACPEPGIGHRSVQPDPPWRDRRAERALSARIGDPCGSAGPIRVQPSPVRP